MRLYSCLSHLLYIYSRQHFEIYQLFISFPYSILTVSEIKYATGNFDALRLSRLRELRHLYASDEYIAGLSRMKLLLRKN